MWKKDEVATDSSVSSNSAAPAAGDSPPARHRSEGRASIGSSITIRGEVSGDEDLLIEGQVDGAVDLGKHAVTVGSQGRVKAGVTGRVVTIEGTVQGDLRAEEVVVLRSTARVEGDITAPRLVLEDGASFRGAVDMGNQSDKADRMDKTDRTDRTEKNRSRGGRPLDARPSTSGSGSAKESVGVSTTTANGSADGASASPDTAGLDA